jgi:hypothetical protein
MELFLCDIYEWVDGRTVRLMSGRGLYDWSHMSPIGPKPNLFWADRAVSERAVLQMFGTNLLPLKAAGCFTRWQHRPFPYDAITQEQDKYTPWIAGKALN